MFIFFVCPKKKNQKKGHFFIGIFCALHKNHIYFPKFLTRIQKFLTENKYLTLKKKKLNKLLGYIEPFTDFPFVISNEERIENQRS